ncbi:histidine kinase N-terminal 7TM domain-containing protein [Halobaculum limi]|uniref:histidine kinase N-terminal 7TM domain-containing protein n=1 Tax=Halobaculum limi TaxID=3031916 RepID=UPI0024059F44|nr:histidine kinase N-terminal 7TM domain-containing protein [Halobaculum sp. YSMS11]
MLGFEPWGIQYWYVAAYAIAVVGCGIALRRAVVVDDDETRRGLVALLVSSGGWAAAQLAYLLAPPAYQYGLYLTGLIVGLTTIGGWLYFCSAYSGRAFHRNTTVRRAAVGVYLAIVAVKLTNPAHELYFTAEQVATPFVHLAVQQGVLHWVVTGFSYALVAIGFFMLMDQFLEADFDTRPLAALVGATALPVVFNLVEYARTPLLDLSLEPVGVAVFAVGTLYVFEDRFLSVQLSDGVDDPLIYLDEDDRVRETNDRAVETFPDLRGARGARIGDVLPGVGPALGEEDGLYEDRGPEGQRYFLATTTEFVRGHGSVGRLVMLSDVTGSEQRRRELARQNEQLESIAAAMRHELFNTLQIVAGRVDIAGSELEGGDVTAARESLQTASKTAERMRRLVRDFADLARKGKTIEATEWVEVGPTAESAWASVDTDDAELVRHNGGRIEADPERLDSLLVSGFRFAVHNDASRIDLELHDDGFTLAGDGNEYHNLDPEAFFEYGGAVPTAKAGIALPNLRTLAEVHGWSAHVDPDYEGGVRVVVSDAHVDVRENGADVGETGAVTASTS